MSYFENHSVAGVRFRVYRPLFKEKFSSVAILFLLHGRGSTLESVDWIAKTLVQNRSEEQQLWIVSFDQRNHGSRLVDSKANLSWKDGNEQHALDMYAIFAGTASDVSLLIHLLPSFLFPNDEKKIESWGVAGVSLGGHATWKVLGEDPRITVGIPIIGCPDYAKLMKGRATKSDIPFAPPFIPDGLITDSDPKKWNFEGKNILVLSGGADNLVPWSASQEFVENLSVGQQGVKKVIVQAGIGHECTEEMVAAASEFVGSYLLR